jgi:hypothetical protein
MQTPCFYVFIFLCNVFILIIIVFNLFLIALTTTYNITVITSDLRNAGTDSTVYIQLFGEKNESGLIKFNVF